MEFFLKIDTAIFNLISVTLKNGFFDFIMPILSDSKLWILPLVIVWLAFIVFGKKKGFQTAILCLIAVVLSDFICGSVLQPIINRPRPLAALHILFLLPCLKYICCFNGNILCLEKILGNRFNISDSCRCWLLADLHTISLSV